MRMKLRWWNHLGTIVRKDLKVLRGDSPIFVILLILFPLALSFFYSLMYQNIMDQNIELKGLTLYISIDQEKPSSHLSMEAWAQMVGYGSFPFLEVVPLSAPEGLEDLLKEENRVGLVVSGEQLRWVNHGNDTLEKEMVLRYLSEAVREANLSIMLQSQIASLSGPEHTELYNAYIKHSQEIDQTSFVQELPQMEIRALSSREYFMISVFVSFSLFFSTGIVLQREKKLVRRAFATGLSKRILFSGNALTTFSLGFLMMSAYFLLTFYGILQLKVPLFPLLLVVAMQATMITGFHSMLMGLCKTDKSSTLISVFVLMIFLLLGGGNFPADTFPAGETLANVIPNYNVSKLYEALILEIPLMNLLGRFGLVLSVSAVMGMIGWFAFMKKEED